MSIVRYDPFRDMRTLQEEVNRLFSTNLTRAFGDEGIGRGAWSPSVDIYENKDQIVLEAELPGMKQEDFDLAIENNVITLRGERRFEKTDETDNYQDRKSTRLNSSHLVISYAVFCLKKKKKNIKL